MEKPDDPSVSDRDDYREYHPVVFEDPPVSRHLDVLANEQDLDKGLILEPYVLRDAQKSDAYCKQLMLTVGKLKSAFEFHVENLLMRRSPLDVAVQRIVPIRLQQQVLYQHH